MRNYHSQFSFSPIGGSAFSGAVRGLITANIAVFIVQQFWGRDFEIFFGLVPVLVLQKLMIWQLFTYMFLHGSFFHLFFNMFVIWMFGRSIESQWGVQAFLKYYFFTGIGAAVLTVIFTPHSPIPTVGASGAIYGLLVAFAMMYPQATIYLYFLIPVTARQLVIVFAFIEFFSIPRADGIARFAHLGGMLFGYLYLKFGDWLNIRWHYVIKENPVFNFKFNSRKRKTSHTVIDLNDEVNKILDKILVKGPGSLTSEEEEIMKRYSKRKH
ncbi:MAG: rhomboid family intramembrane serine protease [bacterium]